MQPEPSLFQQVSESLQAFALDRLWQWLAGLVVAAVLALRAHFRGVKGPSLYLPLGAVLGIGTVVGVTALFAWSRYVFYSTAGVLAMAVVVYGTVHVYRREQARLRGHPKGLFDYLKDLKSATVRNASAAARLTKETTRIGTRTVKFTRQYQRARSEPAQETVLNRTARMYRGAAIRYRRHAAAWRESTVDFADAMTGIFTWYEETGKLQQLQEQRPIIEKYRASIASTRDNLHDFRDSIIKLPNMSQRLNAARGELLASLDISLIAIEAAGAFADDAVGRTES